MVTGFLATVQHTCHLPSIEFFKCEHTSSMTTVHIIPIYQSFLPLTSCLMTCLWCLMPCPLETPSSRYCLFLLYSSASCLSFITLSELSFIYPLFYKLSMSGFFFSFFSQAQRRERDHVPRKSHVVLLLLHTVPLIHTVLHSWTLSLSHSLKYRIAVTVGLYYNNIAFRVSKFKTIENKLSTCFCCKSKGGVDSLESLQLSPTCHVTWNQPSTWPEVLVLRCFESFSLIAQSCLQEGVSRTNR